MFTGLEEIDLITDPAEALNMFNDIINKILSNHALVLEKRVKRDQQSGWFTDEILSTIHDRDKCHKAGKKKTNKNT